MEEIVGTRSSLDWGKHDDAGNALAQQHVNGGNRNVRAAFDVAEHRCVARAEGGALHALRHLGVVGVAEVVHKDA